MCIRDSIIAARPAIGKTAFVLSMAKYLAVDNKIPVALFNLEMSSVQLVKRLISNVCELPGEKLKSGQLENFEWTQLDERISVLENTPLYICLLYTSSILQGRAAQQHSI